MQIVNQNDPSIKVTFGDTVTYRGTPNLDRIGTIEPDDKRTSASSKLWLVKWKGDDAAATVEHECNLARVDEVADVRIQDEGSLFIAHLDSQAAREWVLENIGQPAQWWSNNGLVVEHRFIDDIITGMLAAGLAVE